MGECYSMTIDQNFKNGDTILFKFRANKNLFDHQEVKLYLLPHEGYAIGFQASLFDHNPHEIFLHEREETTLSIEVHEHISYSGYDSCDSNSDQAKFAKCFRDFQKQHVYNQSEFNSLVRCNGSTYKSCQIPHVTFPIITQF